MICDNIISIRKRIENAAIRAGRNPMDVQLLGATKNVSVSKIKEAVSCGLTLFGENYIQEARSKIEELGPGLNWHFIGRLQVNKAKHAVKMFDVIHSLDGIDLARELDRRAGTVPRIMPVLIEVNLAGEETKGGVPPEDLVAFVQSVSSLKNLKVTGLMTLPPFFDDAEKARPYFRQLKELKEFTAKRLGAALAELSMGMTGDFEAAVEEGATMVRIGTALFGPRLTKSEK